MIPNTHEPIPERRLYSLRETRQIINLSNATIWRRIARGDLDAVKVGSRTFIPVESIERFLAELPKIGGPSHGGKA